MKTILKYFVLSVFITGFLASCNEKLETNPTDQVAGPVIFADETAAQTAINGCYSLLWRPSYVSANASHAYGIESTWLAQDLMVDDMIQMTFNWFGFDYDLSYTSLTNVGTASRNYNVWNMMYTIISNTNYIIAEDGRIGQNGNVAKNIVAQAYALRAFCYFELIQGYQKTYLGNETAPGVPVYTLPTRSGDEGKPRGTVQDVYTQINADITRAIDLFTEIGKPRQEHCSHIDYYVTKGFEARIALVQGRNADAVNAANEALSRLSTPVLSRGDLAQGLSDKGLATNLWTMEMISEQSQIYGSIYCHLDPRSSTSTSTSYGSNHRKCISQWLYNKVGAADARKSWWMDGNQGGASDGVYVNYGQMKRLARDLANWVGDIIFMRGEEMLLIKAEAQARQSLYNDARVTLKTLMAERMTTSAAVTAYNTYLDALPDGNALSAAALANTNTDPANVLEEIVLQRRIELWGELGRVKDILRLKQGYNRVYSGSNHTELLSGKNTAAESGSFLFKIPQSEFDGNKNISSNEQNPLN